MSYHGDYSASFGRPFTTRWVSMLTVTTLRNSSKEYQSMSSSKYLPFSLSDFADRRN